MGSGIRLGLLGLGLSWTLASSAIQEPEADGSELTPETIVQTWFETMNELNEDEASRKRVLELYAESATHVTGPGSHQRGTATFVGHEALNEMLQRRTKRYRDIQYRIDTATANEQTVNLIHQTIGPWGGAALAVQFTLAQTERETGLRTFTPGALFLQLGQENIQLSRVYLASGESAEVEPRP